jgi:hypothetical protein
MDQTRTLENEGCGTQAENPTRKDDAWGTH